MEIERKFFNPAVTGTSGTIPMPPNRAGLSVHQSCRAHPQTG